MGNAHLIELSPGEPGQKKPGAQIQGIQTETIESETQGESLGQEKHPLEENGKEGPWELWNIREVLEADTTRKGEEVGAGSPDWGLVN